MINPRDFEELEDRVLYELVGLAGDAPLPLGSGFSESQIAARMTDALGITAQDIEDPVASFHTSRARLVVLDAVTSLENKGLVDAVKVFGPWTIRPTRAGRDQVRAWRRRAQDRHDRQVAEARRRWLDAFAGRGGAREIETLAVQTGLPRSVLIQARESLETEGLIRGNALTRGGRGAAGLEARGSSGTNRSAPFWRRTSAPLIGAVGVLILAAIAAIGTGLGTSLFEAAKERAQQSFGLCDLRARFVDEAPTDDKGHTTANAQFVKTWRWLNEGTCDWSDGYEARFVDGDQMGAPASIPLTARRNEIATITVRLIAPAAPGEYCSDWSLRAPGGREIRTNGMWVVLIVDAAPPAPPVTPRPRQAGCAR